MNSIELTGVTKSFGDTPVLARIDAAIERGSRVAILGPSGCGKTTLLRLVAGLDYPDAGQISLDGKLASRPGWVLEPHRRGIGFVFQSGALWPHMTVAQNVLFGLRGVDRSAAAARLQELAEQMEIEGLEARYPDQLSSGQIRRVALARALAPRPSILLLDEPLTNVQPDLRARLAELISESVARTSATLVHVTHDETEASQLATRLLRMHSGKLSEGGAGRATPRS